MTPKTAAPTMAALASTKPAALPEAEALAAEPEAVPEALPDEAAPTLVEVRVEEAFRLWLEMVEL